MGRIAESFCDNCCGIKDSVITLCSKDAIVCFRALKFEKQMIAEIEKCKISSKDWLDWNHSKTPDIHNGVIDYVLNKLKGETI